MTPTPLKIGWFIFSAGLIALIGYGVPRPEFNGLITLYGLLCWGYWLRISPFWRTSAPLPDQPDPFLFSAAIGFRLVLVAAIPLLSDDYTRFIWDGRLLINGQNPYLYLPRELVGTSLAESAGLGHELFKSLNSPDYFTVYPPLSQALFGAAAWLGGNSVPWTIFWLRVPILLAEIGSLWLMVRLLPLAGRNPNLALLYGLNPLVILELTGNLHAEGIMIFFTLVAVWLFATGRAGSAGALALAVGTKLLPLLLLPIVVRHLGWKRGLGYAGLTGLLTVCLFLPFASVALVQNMFSSLNLYFQLFEFNASVQAVIQAVGYWVVGRNITVDASFWLFPITVLGVLGTAFGTRRFTAPVVAGQVLATLTVYLALATTVHPWYVTPLVAVAVFTRFRYPLLWSGLIWLSYATYRTEPYHENGWLTGLEYSLVIGFGVYELIRTKNENVSVDT